MECISGRNVSVSGENVKREEDFGQLIRQARNDVGLSLREAASRLGVSYSALQFLESNRQGTIPHDDVLRGMARLYGISLLRLKRAARTIDAYAQLSDGSGALSSFRTIMREKFKCHNDEQAFATLKKMAKLTQQSS